MSNRAAGVQMMDTCESLLHLHEGSHLRELPLVVGIDQGGEVQQQTVGEETEPPEGASGGGSAPSDRCKGRDIRGDPTADSTPCIAGNGFR